MLRCFNAVATGRSTWRNQIRQARAQQCMLRNVCRHVSNQSYTFQEGDVALLRTPKNLDAPPLLTQRLRHDGITNSHRGSFSHSDIIGRRARDVVVSNRGQSARLQIPTLGEYVTNTPRLVTPVYSGDANLIVSLLDLHAVSSATRTANLEILEAGTGHGSLTIHLSRAIHGANGPVPGDDATEEDHEAWKHNRQAILHTVDTSRDRSNHARKMIMGFRRGLYAGNIDYHVGDVSEFVLEQFEKRRTINSFLSHVLLDLPGPEKHLGTIGKALHVDGSVVVFTPSITQITRCAKAVKDDGLPLWLDQVVELGAGFTAGRQWDVRYVKPRALGNLDSPQEDSGTDISTENPKDSESVSTKVEDVGWEMVCRPKVGQRLVGGGFVGVWKKTQVDRTTPS